MSQPIVRSTIQRLGKTTYLAWRIGGYGQGPYGQRYLLIDYGEGSGEHRWQPDAHLMEYVVRFRRDFFRAYRPIADLPVSKHHVDRLRSNAIAHVKQTVRKLCAVSS